MSVDTVTVNNTGENLGKLAFPSKETFKSKNNIASLDDTGKLVLSQAPYVAGTGIRISNTGIISATGGGSGGSTDEHNKGWFATADQLPETGEDGDYAIVGSTDTVWIWDSDTSKWVDSGAKGLVQTVNHISAGEDGNVELTGKDITITAEDVETTEEIVYVGPAGITVEAALANIAQGTKDNSDSIGTLSRKLDYINTDATKHTTTIDGILDVVDNEAFSADIRFKGESILTKINAKQNQLKNYSETERSSQIDAKADDTNGGYINLISEGGITPGDFDITVGKSSDGDGGRLDILVEAASENKTASKLNISADEINISGSFKVNGSPLSDGTVKSVNSQVPNNEGNVELTSANIPDIAEIYATKTSLDGKQDKTDDTLATIAKTIVGAINELNTSNSSKASQTDLTTLQNKVANISRDDGKTFVTGVLEMQGATDSDTPTVDTGKKGQVLTNTLVVSDEIDTAKISMSGNEAVVIDSFETTLSNSATSLPTSSAVWTALGPISQSISSLETETQTLSTSKQNKLIAGNNIEISEDNTISVTGLQSVITESVETTITPTASQTATAIPDILAKAARVIVTPHYTNVGAVYIKESDTYSSINPIYPDPANNVYEFTNMQNVKVFVDSIGDAVDLVIEYRG